MTYRFTFTVYFFDIHKSFLILMLVSVTVHSYVWYVYFSLSVTFWWSLGSSLTLKVWVKDSSSQKFLKGALVCVFVNGSQIQSSQTLENGEVTLTVPYHLGLTLTLVASRGGYVLSQLPWKTTKMPSKPHRCSESSSVMTVLAEYVSCLYIGKIWNNKSWWGR